MPIIDDKFRDAVRAIMPESVLDACEDFSLGFPGIAFPVGADKLEAMPTLCEGHADDLKYEDDDIRVWLSRCGLADGMPYEQTACLEFRDELGRWIDVGEWDAEEANEIDLT